jgi:hypothetical protein
MTYKQLCEQMGKSGWASHVPAACRAKLRQGEVRGRNKVFTVANLEATATFGMYKQLGKPPDFSAEKGRPIAISFYDPKPQSEKATAYDRLGIFMLAKNARAGALEDVRHNILE